MAGRFRSKFGPQIKELQDMVLLAVKDAPNIDEGLLQSSIVSGFTIISDYCRFLEEEVVSLKERMALIERG